MSGMLQSFMTSSGPTDGTFQKYTVIVALVVLIGTLTIMGAAMYNSIGNYTFPPNSNSCPDYWDIKDGQCVDPEPNSPNDPFNVPTTFCEKKTWAMKNSTISWDGVSNSKEDCGGL
jgi:hypothetical protein